MSIETRIQAINDHLIDDYKVLRLAGADLTGVNKNIVNLKMSWKERLLYFMNNGTDEVWNNWDKVSGTGTTLSLNNTEEAPMSLTYKGNTSQNGTPTPTSPIPVQVVSGDNSIEISNGTQSASYPISLGDIELCKIGTYQDKIDKSTGKNFFDESILDTKKVSEDDDCYIFDNSTLFKVNLTPNVTFKENTSYTIQYIAKQVGTGNPRLIISYTDGTYENVGVAGISTILTTYTQISNANKTIDYISGIYGGTGSFYIKKNSVLVYEGSIQNPVYEPYGTVWYLKKEIGKVSNLSSYYRDLTTNYNNLQYIRINKMTNSANYGNSSNIPVIFTHGIYQVITSFDQAVNIGRITSSGGYTYFYFGVDKTTTVEQAQTLLSNATIYYPLSTPIYEEIEDTTLLSQLEALKKSYESVTNISQVNNDLPFELNITALSNE